ncbi:hypothetical protein BGW42_005781 [Actinomortierella wolfii]|nr:hypothetical protein BGW42_005781 [Actinomortierella wolfii]
MSLSIGNFIGAGGYGSVYHARWGTRKVAIKLFSVTKDEAHQAADIQREIKLLEKLRDRYIIQFYGTTYHQNNLVLVMDFAEGGSLQRAIEKRRLDWPAKIRIAQEITRGLAYIHHENILHRDLKSGNVLLSRHMEVKLCDFGLATVKVQSASKSSGDSLKGTLRWMAPELFAKRPKYSTKSDIFALGMVMWEMAADCTKPFKEHGDNAMIALLISRGEREDLPDDTPDDYRRTVEQCWESDPAMRPEASDMLKDDEESDDDSPGSLGEGPTVSISMEFSDVHTISTSDGVAAQIEDSENNPKGIEDDEGVDDLVDHYFQPADNVSILLDKAKEGDIMAQSRLGEMYERGVGVERNDSEAFKWYLEAAKQGDVASQHKTGVYYSSGRGTDKNPMEAVSWFQKAANQGYSPSQFDLGARYETGAGIEKNQSEALAWYTKAAEHGNTDAQLYLGGLFATGQGVERDMTKAVHWYREAASRGDESAQQQLAMMYSEGKDVDQNYEEARHWLLKLAENGNAVAQFNLGSMYEQGKGTDVDIQQAIEWYTKAVENGHRRAQRRVDILKKRL